MRVLQGFIRVADLQNLTYAAEKAASIAGGETVEQLEVTFPLQPYPSRPFSLAWLSSID